MDVLCRESEVVAQGRVAEEAEDGRGAHRALEAIEGVSAHVADGARQEPPEEDLDRSSADGAQVARALPRALIQQL